MMRPCLAGQSSLPFPIRGSEHVRPTAGGCVFASAVRDNPMDPPARLSADSVPRAAKSNSPSATTPALSKDKRKASRRRVLKAAIAAFCDRHCTIACTVRDISQTGARLICDSTLSIPDTFELIVELDGIEADCEVVWRTGNELGVRFQGEPRRLEPRRRQVVRAREMPGRKPNVRRSRTPT